MQSTPNLLTKSWRVEASSWVCIVVSISTYSLHPEGFPPNWKIETKADHKCTCGWPGSVPAGQLKSKTHTWICAGIRHRVPRLTGQVPVNPQVLIMDSGFTSTHGYSQLTSLGHTGTHAEQIWVK
jgi:hypothetical protein